MDLHSRLKSAVDRKRLQQRLLDSARTGALPGVLPAGEHFRRAAEAPPPEQRPPERILRDAFPAAEFAGPPECRVVVIRERLRAEAPGEREPQGCRFPLAAAESLDAPGALELLHPGLADAAPGLRPEEILFIDTETTGLAGGAGTLAFLVGIGWFERGASGALDAFVVEQLLIEDFRHEPAMIEALVERAGRFRAFCSYNGKSFDLPVLRARGVLNRVRPSAWDRPHFDLLHAARRFWRGAFGDVRLATIESCVLGIERGPDIAGAEIPAVWDQFARTGAPGRLPLVVSHNAQDIASLGCLMARQASMLLDPEQPGLMRHWTEFAGAGRFFESRGDHALAARLLHEALGRVHDGDDHDRLVYRLAKLRRRMGEVDLAVEAWNGMLALPLHRSLPAWIESAKHAEHRLRDPGRARQLVAACLRQVELEEDLRRLTGRRAARPLPDRLLDDLRRRRERLDRKLAPRPER